MLDTIAVWIDTPSLLFLVCAATGLVIPLPEDVVLLYVGIRAHEHELAWGPTMLAAAAGMLLRDVTVYFIGRGFGDWLFTLPAVEKFLGAAKIDHARQVFTTRGTQAVLIGRFLIGMRVPFFCVAGAMRTPFRKFLLWDGLGTLLTVPILMGLGAWLGAPIMDIALWVVRSMGATLWALLFASLGGWWFWRRRQNALALAAAIEESEEPVASNE